MTSWLEDFREGSFRGVPFKTESHALSGGRRKQDREFAKREEGNSEDLGRQLRKYTLELLVLGDDYFTQRDALVSALETTGPGELIHPYLGTVQVQSGSFTLSETKEEGRMARFSVEFTEAGAVRFPDQVENTLDTATDSADLTIENSKSFFEKTLDTVNEVAFVIQSAADDAAALVDGLEAAVTSVTAPVATLTQSISELKADLDDLVKLPGELADRIAGVFDDLLAEFEDEPKTSERILFAFVGTLDDQFEPIAGSTPSRVTQINNQTATRNLGNEIGLSNQAKAAVQVDFVSTDEALTSRNAIIDGFDAQLDVVDDDDLFQSIREVQAALAKAVPSIGTSELISFTPKKTIPALVIAYDLFEDLDKEVEIVDQNKIEHPGFVPGGDEILISAG